MKADRDSSLRVLCGSESRYRLFRALFRSRDDQHLRGLAESAGVDPAQVHRLLPHLIGSGLCERVDARPHPRYRAAKGHPLYGALARLFSVPDTQPGRVHERPMKRAEERSLALHTAAVRRIREDPHALRQARSTLEKWMARYEGDPPQALEEWSRILALPPGRIEGIVLDRSERGDRIRKSSPLSTLVTREERRRIYAAH